jgi:heme oxygenase (biliverdin-IX-beta and delta-forming)
VSARAVLREQTAADHERVDALFSRFDLSDRTGYARFLTAQATAFLPIESALDAAGAEALIPDWPERRRAALLTADLEALFVPQPAVSEPECRLDDRGSMFGAIYVLEGSRLGGTLLKRQVHPDWPRRFLDAPQPPGTWRSLLMLLDKALQRPEEMRAALGAARGVFRRFEAAALAELRT